LGSYIGVVQMIFKNKKKSKWQINAPSIEDACKELGISKERFKKEWEQVIFTLKTDDEIEEDEDYYKKDYTYEKQISNYTSRTGKRDHNLKQKALVRELKTQGCAICGYDKCHRALTFHHVEPCEKSFEIRVGRVRYKYLQEEVAKCILLCLNCHAEVHEVMENGELKDMEGV